MKTIILMSYLVVLFGVVGMDFYYYRRFIRILKSPFEELHNNISQKSRYDTVASLYDAYKMLPKGKFNLVKMKIRAWNKPDIIPQSIDSFMKIVVSLLLTTSGIVITILIANLNIANSNKELHKDQRIEWINNMRGILETLLESMSLFQILLYIAFFMFTISFVHILISYSKNSLYKKHIIVIDEIEKEYSQK